MRTYTAHLHRRKPPVLVPEAFSWAGLVFGPLWLLWHRAWIAAVLAVAALVLAATVPPPALRSLAVFGVMLLIGLFGQDLRRWTLGLRRFQLSHVVAARDQDEAMFRLLSYRVDLLERAV